jgi:hypothetical protein
MSEYRWCIAKKTAAMSTMIWAASHLKITITLEKVSVTVLQQKTSKFSRNAFFINTGD